MSDEESSSSGSSFEEPECVCYVARPDGRHEPFSSLEDADEFVAFHERIYGSLTITACDKYGVSLTDYDITPVERRVRMNLLDYHTKAERIWMFRFLREKQAQRKRDADVLAALEREKEDFFANHNAKEDVIPYSVVPSAPDVMGYLAAFNVTDGEKRTLLGRAVRELDRRKKQKIKKINE